MFGQLRSVEHKVGMFAYASDRGVYTDTPLSDFATAAFAAANSMENFVAERFAPAINVGKQSAFYPVIDPQAFQRAEVNGALRAPKTRANKVDWTLSSAQFFCHNYALAHDIALEDMRNEDAAVNLRENGTLLVVGGLKLLQEIRVANLVTSISNVGSGVVLTGVNKWSDAVNSDPLAAITTAQAFIRQRTGLRPNTAVVDEDTFAIMRRHPQLIDYYKYTAGGLLPASLIANLIGIPEANLLIAGGVRDNQREGLGASSITNIWGNCFVLAHVGANLGQQSQIPVARFQWNENGVYPNNLGVLTSQDDSAGSTHSETIEVGHFQSENIVARNLCYTIRDTV